MERNGTSNELSQNKKLLEDTMWKVSRQQNATLSIAIVTKSSILDAGKVNILLAPDQALIYTYFK